MLILRTSNLITLILLIQHIKSDQLQHMLDLNQYNLSEIIVESNLKLCLLIHLQLRNKLCNLTAE